MYRAATKWADRLVLYFKDFDFLVQGFVIDPINNGTLWEADAILLLSLSLLP